MIYIEEKRIILMFLFDFLSVRGRNIPVVIEFGSFETRVGYAGEKHPSIIV